MTRRRLAALALGLLSWLPAGSASAAEQNLTVTCTFDQTESGSDPDGTVADGLGGAGVSLQFDFANAVVRFRDGGTYRLTKADDQVIEFQEKEYTVTYHRDYGDLVSHDNKSGYDGTFNCVRVERRD